MYLSCTANHETQRAQLYVRQCLTDNNDLLPVVLFVLHIYSFSKESPTARHTIPESSTRKLFDFFAYAFAISLFLLQRGNLCQAKYLTYMYIIQFLPLI